MSDEPITESGAPVTDETPGGMRAKLKEQAAEIARLEAAAEESEGLHRAQTISQAFTSLGLDPEHGIGRAAAVTFEGEPGELAAFVEEEFGYTLEAEHPMARSIMAGQSALDQIGNTAGSIKPPDRDDELQSAEARGDYDKTLRMKTKQMEAWFRPQA